MDMPFHLTPPYPVVRLSPKAEARAIRHGFPWVYAGELVLDRRTKGLVPGSFAVLQDAVGQAMGVVTVNSLSKIACRMMDPDPAAVIDGAWVRARIARALAHRARLYEAPFYRLVHAEADGLPGVVIDRFGDVAVLQPNAAWSEAMAGVIAEAWSRWRGSWTVVKNGSGRARGLEGLPEEMAVIAGPRPAGPVAVPMNGATYMADVMGGQKTGLFFDQRPNHAFVASLARGGACWTCFPMWAGSGWRVWRGCGLGAGGGRVGGGAGAGRGWRGGDGGGGPVRHAAGRCVRRAGLAGRGRRAVRRGDL